MEDLAGRRLPAPVARDRRRVVIEDVTPSVDGGRFPARRIVGEPLDVSALVFAEGDDALRVVVRHRSIAAESAEPSWTMTPMRPAGGDRWQARIASTQSGYVEFAVVAWVDYFATWRRDLDRRRREGLPLDAALLEGAELVRRAANHTRSGLAGRPSPARDAAGDRLLDRSAQLRGNTPESDRALLAMSDELYADMITWAPVVAPVTHAPLRVRIERAAAGFAAWYDADPAALVSADAARDTDDVATTAGLRTIHDLGFDVVVVPARVIGGVLPALTSAACDADRITRVAAFVASAGDAGLESALPITFACSRRDPAFGEHPEWFKHAPDGSPNPMTGAAPGSDLVAFDFEGESWESIWVALRDQVLAWVDRGVLTFVVDQPEAAPFTFWEWLTAEVQRDHPDVMFVADGFGRATVARRLAKIGFSQLVLPVAHTGAISDLAARLEPFAGAETGAFVRTQLAAGDEIVEFIVAATSSALYRARPSTGKPIFGTSTDLVRTIHAIRRSHGGFGAGSVLDFHDTDNPHLLCYSRVSADGRERALVVVNTDRTSMQHGWVQVPAEAWELSGEYVVRDELTGEAFTWKDSRNYVRLEARTRPAHVLIFPRLRG